MNAASAFIGTIEFERVGRRTDVKLSRLSASVMLLAVVSGSIATRALAEQTPIVVLSAEFGPAKTMRPVDFTERLARTCGASVSDCQAFCTRAAVGRPPWEKAMFFPPRLVCRITYRCGALLTKVTEADENDTFTLSCRPRP